MLLEKLVEPEEIEDKDKALLKEVSLEAERSLSDAEALPPLQNSLQVDGRFIVLSLFFISFGLRHSDIGAGVVSLDADSDVNETAVLQPVVLKDVPTEVRMWCCCVVCSMGEGQVGPNDDPPLRRIGLGGVFHIALPARGPCGDGRMAE